LTDTLGFPELSIEQIELLCQTTEDAARKYILGKVQSKDVERLEVAVEVEGAKPVNVTVEVNLLLGKDFKSVDAEALVKEAIAEAHKATETFLRQIK